MFRKLKRQKEETEQQAIDRLIKENEEIWDNYFSDNAEKTNLNIPISWKQKKKARGNGNGKPAEDW